MSSGAVGTSALVSLWKTPLPSRLPSSCYTVQAARGSGPGGQGVNSSSNKTILHLHVDTLMAYLSEDIAPGYKIRMQQALEEAAFTGARAGSTASSSSSEKWNRRRRKQQRKLLAYQLQHQSPPPPTTTTTHKEESTFREGEGLEVDVLNDERHHETRSIAFMPDTAPPTLSTRFLLPSCSPHPLGSLHFHSHRHRSRAANEAACLQSALDFLQHLEKKVLRNVAMEQASAELAAAQVRAQDRIQRPREVDGHRRRREERGLPHRGITEEGRSKDEEEDVGVVEPRRGLPKKTSQDGHPRKPSRLPSRMGDAASAGHDIHQKRGSSTTYSRRSSSVVEAEEEMPSAMQHPSQIPRVQPSFFFSKSFSSYLTKRKHQRREKGSMRSAQRAARAGKW